MVSYLDVAALRENQVLSIDFSLGSRDRAVRECRRFCRATDARGDDDQQSEAAEILNHHRTRENVPSGRS